MPSPLETVSQLPLSDFVTVQPRFARSVHLQRDVERADFASGDYHLTRSSHEALEIVSQAWSAPSERAMTIVGPYGAGKSAFAAFLTRLMQGEAQALAELKARDETLHQKLSASRQLLPVVIVGSRAPLAAALCAALQQTLQRDAPRAWQELQAARKTLSPAEMSPRQVTELFTSAATAVEKCESASGVLLIVDELGKFLEYAASQTMSAHSRHDIFVLQELAEAAARSGAAPLCVLGVLHQNPEAYAHKLGRAQQTEWAKIAQRFRAVPLVPDDVERMDMVGLALQHAPELHLNDFEQLAERCQLLAPPSIAARFGEMARAAYPLHPVALLALPTLFRRAGQSHRSLFNFLSGEEAGALGAFLRETSFDPQAPPLFSLDQVFDYARDSLLSGWGGAGARTWSEAVEVVERAEMRSPKNALPEKSALLEKSVLLEVRALKCIGLLSWLRDARLPASRDVLHLALGAAVEAALQSLEKRKLIAWSRLKGAFRLWEGGDVDVEAELQRARAELTGDVLLALANDPVLCPMPRLVARRHFFETGTLRAAKIVAVRASMLPAARRSHADEMVVLLCLAATQNDVSEAEHLARTISEPNVLVGIALETEVLRESALDVAAAARLPENVPQLANDRAARRAPRLGVAAERITNAVSRRVESSFWRCSGRQRPSQRRRRSVVLSGETPKLCQRAPLQRVFVRNGRRDLSRFAALAQRVAEPSRAVIGRRIGAARADFRHAPIRRARAAGHGGISAGNIDV